VPTTCFRCCAFANRDCFEPLWTGTTSTTCRFTAAGGPSASHKSGLLRTRRPPAPTLIQNQHACSCSATCSRFGAAGHFHPEEEVRNRRFAGARVRPRKSTVDDIPPRSRFWRKYGAGTHGAGGEDVRSAYLEEKGRFAHTYDSRPYAGAFGPLKSTTWARGRRAVLHAARASSWRGKVTWIATSRLRALPTPLAFSQDGPLPSGSADTSSSCLTGAAERGASSRSTRR